MTGYFVFERHIFHKGEWQMYGTALRMTVALAGVRTQPSPWKIVRVNRTWGDVPLREVTIAQSVNAPAGHWQSRQDSTIDSPDFRDEQKRGLRARRPDRPADYLPDEENRGYES